MKRYRTVLLLMTLLLLAACSYDSKIIDEEGASWYKDQDWYKGLNITPHESINKSEFLQQYQKNPKWWNEAFEFLKTHDLNTLATGKYVIDSNNVIATVSFIAPAIKETVAWEAHRNFNDLQYIIKGRAQMGIAAITDPGTKTITPYSSDDNEKFTVSQGKYYNAGPGSFFIFSPKEIHRPAFKRAGYDSIKKIVIKVRVP